jgi:hypothetical protein
MSSGGLSIGELVGTISLNDQFSGPINDVAKAVGLSGESFRAITGAAGLAVGAIGSATAAIVALGIHGADVDDVQSSFYGLAKGVGASGDAMLGALKEGTLGTISNFDLMKASNGALATGLVTTTDQMRTLAAGAHLLADRTGGDTATAFDTLTSAMATGRTQGLKQLGVFSDSDAALEKYAISVHKNVSDLDAHTVAVIKSNSVLSALKAALDAAGPAQVDFGDRINQGKAAIQNMVDSVSIAVANSPVLATAMDAVASAITNAFGGDQSAKVNTLIGYVNQFAFFLGLTASVAVSVAIAVSDAFHGTQMIFNEFLSTLSSGVQTVAGWLLDIANTGAKVPGTIGEGFKAMQGPLQTVVDLSGSLKLGFDDSASSAASAGTTMGNSLAVVQAAVDGVVVGMQEAANATNTYTGSAAAAAPAVKAIGDGMAWTVAQEKAYQDAMLAAITTQDQQTANGIAQTQTLNDQIALIQTTGLANQLLANQQAQATELADLQTKYDVESATYSNLAALIKEKYALMTSAAIDSANSQSLAATSLADSQQTSSQRALETALANYNTLLTSGKATYQQLLAAATAVANANQKIDDDSTKKKIANYVMVAESISGILKSLFGKSKAAAIAAAIIDTAVAVTKSLASAPWPLNLVPAAAALAAGIAQVKVIEGTSYRTGTPGTSFVDFGRGTSATLHGNEAVVNAAQGATLGEVLAGMVGDALRAGENRTVEQLQRMEDSAAARDRLLPLRIRDYAQLAGA